MPQCFRRTLRTLARLGGRNAVRIDAYVLPPPSFRFRSTTDTLGFGCDLPAAGRSRDFHPLERALAGRTQKQQIRRSKGRGVCCSCFTVRGLFRFYKGIAEAGGKAFRDASRFAEDGQFGDIFKGHLINCGH